MRSTWKRVALVALVAALAVSLVACSGPEKKRLPKHEVDEVRDLKDKSFDKMDGTSSGGSGRTTAPSGGSSRNPTDATGPVAARDDGPSTYRSGKRPAWVPLGKSERYPVDKYIYSAGACTSTGAQHSEAMKLAEDRAMSGIARQIRVHVRSEYKNAADLVTNIKAGKTIVEVDRNAVQERLTTTADLKLEGVLIADRWYDSGEKTYWVLAVLERATTAQNILDQMNQQLLKVQQDYEQGLVQKNDGSAFKAAAYFNRARTRSMDLLRYRSWLRAISPPHAATAEFKKTDEQLVTVWEEAIAAAERLRFGVIAFATIDGKAVGTAKTESALGESLRDMGLAVVKLPKLPEASTFEKFKNASADALAGWLGPKANCLVLASVASKHIATENLGKTPIHFYEAGGHMIAMDLSDAREIASAGLDVSNKTRAPSKDRRRAADGALGKASQLLVKDIMGQVGKGLHIKK